MLFPNVDDQDLVDEHELTTKDCSLVSESLVLTEPSYVVRSDKEETESHFDVMKSESREDTVAICRQMMRQRRTAICFSPRYCLVISER